MVSRVDYAVAKETHKIKEKSHTVKTISVEGEIFNQKLHRIEGILFRRNTNAAQVASDLQDIKTVLTE